MTMGCLECPDYKPGVITERCCVCANMTIRMQMAVEPVERLKKELAG
jgi:hypothetical protein